MAKKSSILLNLINLSPKKIKDLVASFSDLDSLLRVNVAELREISSLTNNDIEKILKFRNSKVFDDELRLIEKNKVICLDIFDPGYPSLLREIDSAPLLLYLEGDLTVLNKPLFAIVGSRNATNYGISLAHDYAVKLSSLGIVIISGLARGVDTAAHKGAIETGETVAVLGSGLLNVYPRENQALFEKITAKGVVISEFPLNTPPLPENFPRRNRIVSGLSCGVLVVEAAKRSGALITARLACEQNREVFAIPGPVNSLLSKGPHFLIKDGAKLVETLEDILDELNINFDKFKDKEENLVKLESN
ncbi:MAG: DNA-processing protein DprA [Candidatus Omnitrophica bacterium]|nr:DNA-processing protein DprA [Candidatus Omnitrophota bacterium]